MTAQGFHGRATPVQQPPDVPIGVLAGAAARGLVSGSGETRAATELQPYGGPGLVPSMPQVIAVDADILLDLPPDSLYQDRPLHGGVQTLSAFGEYVPGPPFTGGFQELVGRPALAPMMGGSMQAQAFTNDASWREAPSVLDLCQRTPFGNANGGSDPTIQAV